MKKELKQMKTNGNKTLETCKNSCKFKPDNDRKYNNQTGEFKNGN